MKRWILRVALAAFGLLLIVIAAELAIGWRCNLQGKLHPPLPAPPERKAASSGNQRLRSSRRRYSSELSRVVHRLELRREGGFQQVHLPSDFPYLGSVRQYWSGYCCISRLLRGKYPFNGGEQVMLMVIGTSFSAEYILKGAYENTVGKLSEWTSSGQPTEEDRFAYRVARQYADFVHGRPFYEFQFARLVPEMWKGTSLLGAHWLRKWERKLFLTADYTIEALYCWLSKR